MADSTFICDRKKKLIESVLGQRTRHVTLVFQDLYQPLNASAAIRTAEIFGIQTVYTIEEQNSFKPSVGISRGAVCWVDMLRFYNTQDCLDDLKNKGYTIAATTVSQDAISVNELCIDNKIALFFGNELKGVTNSVIDQADVKTYIPMYGFTQSFNVSVSVGIFLQSIIPRLRESNTIKWRLTDEEKQLLYQQWLKNF